MKEPEDVIKATSVVGTKVIDIENNRLGKIHEIIFNKNSGRISYVIIGNGSFFGIGGDFFALPWHSLYFEPTKKCYIANATKDNLSQSDDLESPETDKAWQHAISNYLTCFVL